MSKTTITEEKLKKELTPEQYERFCKTKKEQGIEEAILQLPDLGGGKVLAQILNCNIKKIRTSYGLTQTDVANVLNLSQREYWRYEHGGYQVNSFKLMSLAIFYNVSLDWFFGLYFCDYKDKPLYEVEQSVNGYTLSKVLKEKNKKKKGNIQ